MLFKLLFNTLTVFSSTIQAHIIVFHVTKMRVARTYTTQSVLLLNRLNSKQICLLIQSLKTESKFIFMYVKILLILKQQVTSYF